MGPEGLKISSQGGWFWKYTKYQTCGNLILGHIKALIFVAFLAMSKSYASCVVQAKIQTCSKRIVGEFRAGNCRVPLSGVTPRALRLV